MAAHKVTGHGGIHKTLFQVQSSYYWESLSTDLADVFACFHECQSNQPLAKSTSFNFVKPKFAFHTISINVLGALNKCACGFKYIMVAIDDLTKWVEAKPIRDLSARTTAKFIVKFIICCHSCPQYIKTDNGTNFRSHVIPLLTNLLVYNLSLLRHITPKVMVL